MPACTGSQAAIAHPSATPVLLGATVCGKTIPHTDSKSFSISRVFDVPFADVAAEWSWRNPIIGGNEATQWKFQQENTAVPQIGDRRLFEAEYPGLGFVRHMEQLRMVVKTERFMVLDVEIVEDSLVTATGCSWRVVVVAASDDASTSCLDYTFTWQDGELLPGDASQEACRALIDSLPSRRDSIDKKWALPIMPVQTSSALYKWIHQGVTSETAKTTSSSPKSFSFSQVYDIPFADVAAEMSWRNPIIGGNEATQWNFQQENTVFPQIGDRRLFEAEYPGIGFVRHMEQLCKVVKTERSMVLEVEVVEDSLFTATGCRWRMVIVAASDDANKSCLEYTFTWQDGELLPGDASQQAARNLFDSLPSRRDSIDKKWALPLMAVTDV